MRRFGDELSDKNCTRFGYIYQCGQQAANHAARISVVGQTHERTANARDAEVNALFGQQSGKIAFDLRHDRTHIDDFARRRIDCGGDVAARCRFQIINDRLHR